MILFITDGFLQDDPNANEFVLSIAERNIKPPSAPESSLLKKRLRYVNWYKSPELVQTDLQRYQLTVHHLRSERNHILEEEDNWLESVQAGRRELLGGLNATEKMTLKLLGIRNAIGDCLFDECHFDSASDFATALKRRSVGSIARDVLDEVDMCHEDCVKSMLSYTEQAAELVEFIAEHNKVDVAHTTTAAPNKRQRRSAGHSAKSSSSAGHGTLSVCLPIPVIALSEEEEKAGKVAAARYLHKYAVVADSGGGGVRADEVSRSVPMAATEHVNGGGPGTTSSSLHRNEENADCLQNTSKGTTRTSRRLANREESNNSSGTGGIGGGGADQSPAEVIVHALMKAEDHIRYLETAAVSDVWGETASVWETAENALKGGTDMNVKGHSKSVADHDSAVFHALVAMSDRECAEKLHHSVGAVLASAGGGIAASMKAKAAKKRSSFGKASSGGPVYVAAHTLQVNARGRALLLSEASRHLDKLRRCKRREKRRREDYCC